MGWTFTTPEMDSHFERNDLPAQVHARGTNVAWKRDTCGHPILFVYRAGCLGSSEQCPSICRGCGQKYYLDPPFRDDRGISGSHLRASGMYIPG
jgi:hypothetical protein